MALNTSGFEAVASLIAGNVRPRTARRQRRDRIARSRRRRKLWLGFTHKGERERYGHPLQIHFDRDGWPMSMRSWCLRIEAAHWPGAARDPYKWVACTKALAEPEVWVSTVWLGTDHGFNFTNEGNYRPVIFETMIFGGPLDQDYQERYCTEAEALEGHARAIEIAKAGKIPDEDGESHRPALDVALEALDRLAKATHGGSDRVDLGDGNFVAVLRAPETRDEAQASGERLDRGIDEVAKAMGLNREDVKDVAGLSDDDEKKPE